MHVMEVIFEPVDEPVQDTVSPGAAAAGGLFVEDSSGGFVTDSSGGNVEDSN